ncbi:MAG: hypothetical protein J5516_02380 [Bacteroidales bacterium]|nr:hypothetical protein [Bacteroidales bacterium]
MEIIYVQLLDEGTRVYRPVPAIKIRDDIYELKGAEIYDTTDETWEFVPGSHVMVKEEHLGEKNVLVAHKLFTQ